MIGRLTGVLSESRPDRVLLDVGGVGYEVLVPLSTFTALPHAGATVTLHIHTHVREDALLLFGFPSAADRAVFERLLTVSGIGPRLAITILSGLSASELVTALARQDVKRLVQVPGVGRRLAERLVVELREKVADLAPSSSAAQDGRPSAGAETEDAIGALLNLGYRRAQAESAVEAARAETGGHDLSVLLAAALRRLSR